MQATIETKGDPTIPATNLGMVLKADQAAAFETITAGASSIVEVDESNITLTFKANMPPQRGSSITVGGLVGSLTRSNPQLATTIRYVGVTVRVKCPAVRRRAVRRG